MLTAWAKVACNSNFVWQFCHTENTRTMEAAKKSFRSYQAFWMCLCVHELRKYTISAIPPLVKGLLKSTQSAAFESVPLQDFQLTATEQLQSSCTVILAVAFDLRFSRIKFLSAAEVQLVQTTVEKNDTCREQGDGCATARQMQWHLQLLNQHFLPSCWIHSLVLMVNKTRTKPAKRRMFKLKLISPTYVFLVLQHRLNFCSLQQEN